jgi:hypothetical protein
MRAASFKSLYQKRPFERTPLHAVARGARSRYSTKTSRYRSEVDEFSIYGKSSALTAKRRRVPPRVIPVKARHNAQPLRAR